MPGDRDKIPYETSLSNLLINIVKQAQADGIITADEGELINRIQIDARDFEQEAAKGIKEGLTFLTPIVLFSYIYYIPNIIPIYPPGQQLFVRYFAELL